jgi:antitoxin (DNA-binding transcriptional repressor) of toxin-antitoxin stability system
MKTVRVRDLRERLSAYLREVRRGEAILVTDHGEVVAELRQPNPADRVPTRDELAYRELVGRGLLVPALPSRASGPGSSHSGSHAARRARSSTRNARPGASCAIGRAGGA